MKPTGGWTEEKAAPLGTAFFMYCLDHAKKYTGVREAEVRRSHALFAAAPFV